MARSNRETAEQTLDRLLDRMHHAQAPQGWEREFRRGDIVDVVRGQAGSEQVIATGTVIRRHRVGWLIRLANGTAYLNYFEVRRAAKKELAERSE